MSNTPLYDALLIKANKSPLSFNATEVWDSLKNSENSYVVLRDTFDAEKVRHEIALARTEKHAKELQTKLAAAEAERDELRVEIDRWREHGQEAVNAAGKNAQYALAAESAAAGMRERCAVVADGMLGCEADQIADAIRSLPEGGEG